MALNTFTIPDEQTSCTVDDISLKVQQMLTFGDVTKVPDRSALGAWIAKKADSEARADRL